MAILPETEFERLLLRSYSINMVAYMKTHPKALIEALELAISDKQPYAWRAAQLVWKFVLPKSPQIQKYINKIIAYLSRAVDNQKRQLFKILMTVDLPSDKTGKLLDESIVCWKDISKVPSLRVVALRMIIKIGKMYPDLTDEILLLNQELYSTSLSPGARRSVQRIFGEMNHR